MQLQLPQLSRDFSPSIQQGEQLGIQQINFRAVVFNLLLYHESFLHFLEQNKTAAR